MSKEKIREKILAGCCFVYKAIEGGKRALDTEGYDNDQRENAITEVKRRDDERWHRVVRQCALDQEGKL